MIIQSLAARRNYSRSNKITTVAVKPSRLALKLTANLLKSEGAHRRQYISQKLLNELSQLTNINPVKVDIADTKQIHRKRNGRLSMKQYGIYRPLEQLIVIQNKTAVRGQALAAKSFVDTLLHEWVHHYDTEKLRLNSIHTKGFYARLTDLKTKLNYYDD